MGGQQTAAANNARVSCLPWLGGLIGVSVVVVPTPRKLIRLMRAATGGIAIPAVLSGTTVALLACWRCAYVAYLAFGADLPCESARPVGCRSPQSGAGQNGENRVGIRNRFAANDQHGGVVASPAGDRLPHFLATPVAAAGALGQCAKRLARFSASCSCGMAR